MGKKKGKRETNKKEKKEKKKRVKFKTKHPKIALFIKLLIIAILLTMVIGTAVVIGMVRDMWDEEFAISVDELQISESNSVIVDSEGNLLAELSGDENRKIISIDEMSKYLPLAYIAIEDERYYEHSGVDIKRTGAAIFTYITNGGKSSFGGSTITQQLVKNITKEDDDEGSAGVKRKIKEWAKAYQVETMLTKEQILELYLNIIFVGSNYHGVQQGAYYYFNKSASELTIAECAFLAGINNSPNSYNPYSENPKMDKIKTRATTVIGKMLELGSINQEQYDEAKKQIDEGYKFEKGTVTGNVYSYHTDALITELIEQIAEEKGISKALAENYLYSSGLKIYSTEVPGIQNTMEEIFGDKSYMLPSKENKDENGNYVSVQSAMVVMDHKTGKVLGVVGGLGEKTNSRGLNRATQSVRQTGSAMKPIATLVPGIEEGIINAATIYNDEYTMFANKYDPKNHNGYRGLIDIREYIKYSENIPAIKILAELTVPKSIEYLENMGITTLDHNREGLPMAIGGLTYGVSPLEMAAAYSAIANDGVYIEPIFYTKVEDSSGNVVMTPKQEQRTVMSKETAYIVKSILQEPVKSGGTARYCAISGIDVAAKTGTTNADNDRWLCGFTNYYTAATWFGYDKSEKVRNSGNPAGKLWDSVMTSLHTGKESSHFEEPANIIKGTVCRTSGLLAGEKCTDTYTEIFKSNGLPEVCDAHQSTFTICTDTGLLANQYCTNIEEKSQAYLVVKERTDLWVTNANAKEIEIPTVTCDVHKEPVVEEPVAPPETNTNTKPEDNTPVEKPDNEEKPSEGNENDFSGQKPNESTGDTTDGGGSSSENNISGEGNLAGGTPGDNSQGGNPSGEGSSAGENSGTSSDGSSENENTVTDKPVDENNTSTIS